MATFEEKQDWLEHALTRVFQAQEQGQARLEQALKWVEGLIPEAGEAVASAMVGSADQAAEAHLEALMRVVDEVSTASRETVTEAAKAIQELRNAIQAEVQASQRMVASEQKVETALDALLPKVAGIREGMEKELGDVVKATAGTEEEIKKMVASIRSSMTKEIEGEIRAKLSGAADQAANRIYGLGEWWDRFTRVGIPMVLVLFAVVSGGLGWWFGQHQMKVEAREEALKDVGENVTAKPLVYQYVKTSTGQNQMVEIKDGLTAPLVLLEGGGVAQMKQGKDGNWYWGGFHWEPKQVPVVRVWDGKTGHFLKDVTSE